MATNRRDLDDDDENQGGKFLPPGFVGEGGRSGPRCDNRFLDRSKVRILLCDNDEKSSREVSELLYYCSYQVISVRTARQVIDALQENGSEIDIILSEIDLPSSKMSKMLKYIMRMEELRHIPIVMMSAKDEVSLVVKCLRLGVADYLVKPLRRNEMLNLWIHMWRRRRMLGLPEKDMWSADVDVLFSDPSDGNTNSALLSDDTDDVSRAVKNQEFDAKANDSHLIIESDKMLRNDLDIQKDEECTSGRIFSCPQKNELKVGKSSAFLTYVKSSQRMNTSADVLPLKQSKRNERTHSHVSHFHDGSFPSMDMNNCPADKAVPYLLPQMMTQSMGTSSCPAVYHQMPMMPSFPFYHQVTTPHLWTSMPGSSSFEPKNGRVERREAALLKFRQKRKDRCFDKKIRYVNRKRLAERRPRVKGQFVRQPNGVSSDLNGDDDEDNDDDDDDDDDNDDDDDDVSEEVSTHRDGSDSHL